MLLFSCFVLGAGEKKQVQGFCKLIVDCESSEAPFFECLGKFVGVWRLKGVGAYERQCIGSDKFRSLGSVGSRRRSTLGKPSRRIRIRVFWVLCRRCEQLVCQG